MPPSSVPKDTGSTSSIPTSPQPPPAILFRSSSSSSNPPPTPRPAISTRSSFEPHTHTALEPTTEETSQSPHRYVEEPETVEATTAEATVSLRAPFFTLINDVSPKSLYPPLGTADTEGGGEGSGEGRTYHPFNVHYIFSDDDGSEALTACLIKALEYKSDENDGVEEEEPEDESDNPEEESKDSSPTTTTATTTGSSSSSATFKSPKTKSKLQSRIQKPKHKTAAKASKKKREERVVIVDLNETGDAVTSVSSLSSNWQVLNARIETAPTFHNTPNSGNPIAGEGLMLCIDGIGKLADSSNTREAGLMMSRKEKKLDTSAVMGEEEMNSLLEGFDRKMGILRGIVGNGLLRNIGDADADERQDILQQDDNELGHNGRGR